MTDKERKTLIANLIVLKGYCLDDPAMDRIINESIKILDKTGDFKQLYQNFRQN